MTKISVVIPCYYSEKTICDIVEETINELNKLSSYAYEFVLVNDGSDDNTFTEILNLAEKYPFVTGVDLSKNFGQHNAIIAGMTLCTGDYILGMDDDFQTHPTQIHKLISKLEEGYDVVYGRFPHRKNRVGRNLGSMLSQYSARVLLDNPKDLTACPMYIMRAFVKDEIIKNTSAYINLRGLLLRTTSKITNTDIDYFERAHGKSGYNFKKLLKLWGAFLNYSKKPVSFVRTFGLLLMFAGLLYFIVSMVFSLGDVNVISSEIIAFSGIIIFIMGILGEYLVRLFMVNTNEPQYVIRTVTHYGDRDE